MFDRLCDATEFVRDKLSEDQLKIVDAILNLNYEIDGLDWNDWNDYYSDKSEDGLEAYVCSVFGLDYTPIDEEKEED